MPGKSLKVTANHAQTAAGARATCAEKSVANRGSNTAVNGAVRGARDPESEPMNAGSRAIRAKLLIDRDHYEALVTQAVAKANISVWISTANLKTMLVEAPIGTRARARGRFISFFETLADLASRNVEVRILHAAPPSRPLAAELAKWTPTTKKKTSPPSARARAKTKHDDRESGVVLRASPSTSATTPATATAAAVSVAMRKCPRVHLKMIAVDGRLLYLGSANLTGAGLGAKGDGRRNFEMGIVTDDERMLDQAQERFDRIWRGSECKSCKVRSQCDRPLDMIARR